MSARWTRTRRAVVTFAAGMLLVMIAAAPAFAQRDPFEPLVTKDTSSSVDNTGNSSGSTNNNQDSNENQPSTDSGALPTTGSDIDGWLAAAYLLVAAGAAAVVVAKTNSTEPARITK
jgi:hypothetical protein